MRGTSRPHQRRHHRPQYRYFLMIGGGILVTLASFLFVSKLTFFGVSADLITLYALFFVLYGNHKESGYLPIMLLGLVRDFLSIGVPGTYAILYALMHKGLAGRKGISYRQNPAALMVLGAVAVFAVNIAYHFTMVVQGFGEGMRVGITRSALMAGMSAPVMPVLVLSMGAVMAFLRVDELKDGCYNI